MNINGEITTYGKFLYEKVNILKIEELKKEQDKLQVKYGAKELDSIYNGRCEKIEIIYKKMNEKGDFL